MCASCGGHTEVVKMLLAYPTVDINMQDEVRHDQYQIPIFFHLPAVLIVQIFSRADGQLFRRHLIMVTPRL